jgi:pimeloyl-ACP methyl ester carboxylesterase
MGELAMIWGFIVLLVILIAPYLLIGLRETQEPAELLHHGMRHVLWNGIPIGIRERGNGAVVVLIHGFGSWLSSWDTLQDALVGAGYRVIAIDMIGSGTSARSLNAAFYTTAAQARMMLEVLDTIGVRQCTLIGHSYGGRVALQMGIYAPERIADIIAIAPEAHAGSRPPIAKLVTIPILGYALAFWSTAPRLIKLGLASVSARKSWLTPERVDAYAAPLHVRGQLAAQIVQSSAPKDGDMPVPTHYRHIKLPVHVIWGDKDPVFPARDGLKMVENILHCDIAIVPNCGHIPHEEAFSETWALILQHLPARTVMLQTYR